MKSVYLSEKDGFPNDTNIEFSPNLNVFIGPNGIGTTHLLDLISERTPIRTRRDKPVLIYDLMCQIADLFENTPQGRGAEEMHNVALILSKHNVCIFDNFADCLGPRQASAFTKLISDWCAEHDTQVICATHTPGVLDALCLSPNRDRLFALDWRSDDVRVCREIKPSPSLDALNETYPLSRLWPMGNIGAV